ARPAMPRRLMTFTPIFASRSRLVSRQVQGAEMKPRIRHRVAQLAAAAAVAVALTAAQPARVDAFNDEYVYVLTKSVDHTHMHPVAKGSLFPITVVLDTAFLPFAVV